MNSPPSRGGRSTEDFYDPYDEDARFAMHQVSNTVQPTFDVLHRVHGVFGALIVDQKSGSIIASSLYSEAVAAGYAAHLPALTHRLRLVASLLDDANDAPYILSILTRKLQIILTFDDASGVAIAVLQDPAASSWSKDMVRRDGLDVLCSSPGGRSAEL